MPEPQWGRLQVDVDCGLRRGAWYRVVSLTPEEAVLDVNRQRLCVPRASLTIVSAPRQSWTVVRRPRDAKGLAAEWGDKYGVCPGCRNRAPLKGSAQSMRCPRCSALFRIAWDAWYLGAG